MQRYILHADGDNFFASCLIAKYPRYRNRPLVVGQERGMVTALSPEAKALGITRGMPIFEIREKHPEVIILAGDYPYFGQISKRMHTLIADTTTCVEKYSIDESFADVTEAINVRRSTPLQIGLEVKNRIQAQLAIPVSIGVAPTKTLAKIVSTSSKPNGFKVAMDNETLTQILANTPIEKVWGIGHKNAVKLRVRGIQTALELRDLPTHLLAQFPRPMRDIQSELRGIMIHQIQLTSSLEQTMISSQSFPATDNKGFIKKELARHIDTLAFRLRTHDAGARILTIYVKNRKQQIISDTSVFMQHEQGPGLFLEQLDKRFAHIYNGADFIRTTGASLGDIIPLAQANISLFDRKPSKETMIFSVMDKLTQKGMGVHMGSLLNIKNPSHL